MKTKKTNAFKAPLLLFTLAILSSCGSSAPQKSPVPATAVAPVVAPVDGRAIFEDTVAPSDLIQADSPSRRQRLVRVNIDALKKALTAQPGDVLRLYPFDNEPVDILIEDIERNSESNIVVVGQIQGDTESSVTLVMRENVLVANIRRGESDESYEIRFNNGGVHTIRVPEPDADETCEEVDLGASAASLPPDDQAFVMANPVVRMLVAYTPRARYLQGGTTAMNALIQMGIADTNRALLYSDSTLRVTLAGTKEVYRNETSDYSSDLGRLRMKYDGKWDEVHAARTRLLADQVTLVGAYTAGGSVMGIGYIGATTSYAFTIVRASSFGQFTFTHELGHNLGLRHSDGYVSSTGRFRTIMAYGYYPRIRRFSNPYSPYNGYRTGDSSHNSVKILNANALRFSTLLTP